MLQCNTCGGIYPRFQADGTQYFHACPPLSDAEITAALGLPLDPTTWTKAQLLAFNSASRVRPNARDENLISTKAVDTGSLKAAGLGTKAAP